MNLHDLYARVCAKRPELAVNADDGPWTLAHSGTDWDWLCNSIDDDVWRCEDLSDSHAAALILARWVEALPVHAGLMRGLDNPKGNPRWYVDGPQHLHPCADTPIEALAAFYLGETT